MTCASFFYNTCGNDLKLINAFTISIMNIFAITLITYNEAFMIRAGQCWGKKFETFMKLVYVYRTEIVVFHTLRFNFTYSIVATVHW